MRFYHLLACTLLAGQSRGQSDEEIHLQWAICDRDATTVLQKLGEEPRDPYKSNPIVYYDTLPPTHVQQGLMFRTKVNKGEPISLIKVRFDEKPHHTPDNTSCVWDRYGDSVFYTCGEKASLPDTRSSPWSGDQVRFAERYNRVNWNKLVSFGPFSDGKWKFDMLGHRAVFDDVVAGELHLMEIEIAVPKAGSEAVFHLITEYLMDRGVVLCNPVLPKTLRLFHEMGYLMLNDDADMLGSNDDL